MLRLGIVGLPNVGKSTLFNALTSSKAAAAENYPFCTVEPNVGVVEVPDPRLARLFELVRPKKKVPAVVEFVDIAGLVRGASQGEGLGNQFLSHIREVGAMVHVIRCFEDPDVVHVMGPVDPVRDHDVITSELALADLSVIERRLDKTRKTARAGDKAAQLELVVLERVLSELNAGRGAREAGETEEAVRFLRQLGLLTAKPSLYAANVNEDDLAAGGGAWIGRLRAAVQSHQEEAEIVPFSAKFESELAELSGEERAEYLASAGAREPGLDRLIHAGYHLLGLQTFFTVGEIDQVQLIGRQPQAVQVQGHDALAPEGRGQGNAVPRSAAHRHAGLAEQGAQRQAPAALQVLLRVKPPKPPLPTIVKPREAPLRPQALRLHHDRRQLDGVDVEQHGEGQRLARPEPDLVLVRDAVPVEDADHLAAGGQISQRESAGGIRHVEHLAPRHRDHHTRDR